MFFTEGDETQRQAAVQLRRGHPEVSGPAVRFFEVPAEVPRRAWSSSPPETGSPDASAVRVAARNTPVSPSVGRCVRPPAGPCVPARAPAPGRRSPPCSRPAALRRPARLRPRGRRGATTSDRGRDASPSGTGADAVELDTTLYLPAAGDDPAPAVVLAHGFGGSKDSVADDARDLAGRGFVVLTFSARGFGASTGQIGLDDPRYEVADLSTLLDLLAERDDVLLDGAGDPRVGVAGASYGGALSLLGAAYDDRVDAIAPQITWNSLSAALFPTQTGTVDGATRRGHAAGRRRGLQAAVGRPVLRASARCPPAAGCSTSWAAGERTRSTRRTCPTSTRARSTPPPSSSS